MKLLGIEKITGKIRLKTGLHIGAGDSDMSIGGTDNPVVKHPFTREPYIPGSSLKGKIRSLLEMKYGLMGTTEGKPVGIQHYKEFEGKKEFENFKNILKLFGSGATSDSELAEKAAEIGPTRLSFSDCMLNNDYKQKASEENIPYFEVKSENTIDRIAGTAKHPRFIERVVQGCEFDYSISLKIFEKDDKKRLIEIFNEGKELLELDALGGSGSRGYGRIEFIEENE